MEDLRGGGAMETADDPLAALSRQGLQALAKKHGIKANQKTEVLIDEINAVQRAP